MPVYIVLTLNVLHTSWKNFAVDCLSLSAMVGRMEFTVVGKVFCVICGGYTLDRDGSD